MKAPIVTPAMRAALLRTAGSLPLLSGRYADRTHPQFGALLDCERVGLVAGQPAILGATRWTITSDGIDALRAEVST